MKPSFQHRFSTILPLTNQSRGHTKYVKHKANESVIRRKWVEYSFGEYNVLFYGRLSF
jgi:hypothetical protein